MAKKMICRLVDVYRDSRNRAVAYKIKSEYDNKYYNVEHSNIKKSIASGKLVVLGLKIDSAGRLIVDKNIRTASKEVRGVSVKVKKEAKDTGLSISTGKDLPILIRFAVERKFNERDCVKEVVDYCINKIPGTLLMLHGIRRTGKTVCIYHTIMNLLNRGIKADRIAYILVSRTIHYRELFKVVKELDVDYIFINEVTNTINFVNEANTLVDELLNKVVVITGTESFALQLTRQETLVMRTVLVRTNLMTLQEFERLFMQKKPTNLNEKKEAINLFIRNSGSTILGAYSDNAGEYGSKIEDMSTAINRALIENIANTVKKNDTGEYEMLKDLSDMQLTFIIYGYVVNTMCKKSRAARDNMEVKLRPEVMNLVRKQYVDDEGELNTSMDGIKAKQKRLVVKALEDMDVINVISNDYTPDVVDSEIYYEHCCNVSALFHNLIEAVTDNNNEHKMGMLAGNITENIVVQQCYVQLRYEYSIKYLRQKNKYDKYLEVDIVLTKKRKEIVIDEEKPRKNYLIEVKHSGKDSDDDWEKFKDDIILDSYGYDVKKMIVYFGDNKEKTYKARGVAQKVYYINIYDFLIDIRKWLD